MPDVNVLLYAFRADAPDHATHREWLSSIVNGAAGNLVQDAWYAALAIESGCEWITVDRDYARFGGLR